MSDTPPAENPGFSIELVDDYNLAVGRAWDIFSDTGDQTMLIELGVLTEWRYRLDEPERGEAGQTDG